LLKASPAAAPAFCFSGTAAAALALPAVTARAQSRPPAIKPQETVNPTREQKHIVKEIVVKDLKVTPPVAATTSAQMDQNLPALTAQ